MDDDEKMAAVNHVIAEIFHGLAKTIAAGKLTPPPKVQSSLVFEFDATKAYQEAADELGIDPADLTDDQRRQALIDAMDELAEEGK